MKRWLLAMLVSSSSALAAEVTLREVRVAAQRAGPEVVLSQLRIVTARADVGVAGILANPVLTVASATQSARFIAGVSVPLPLFGVRGTAIDAASADLETAQRDAEVMRLDARWAASIAWVDLWEATARRQLLELAATDARRIATIAIERRDAGTGSKLDALRTTADRDRAITDAEAALHTELAASARLAPLLGRSDGMAATGLPSWADQLPALQTFATAVHQHVVLKKDRADVDAAVAKIRFERRSRWPQVSGQLQVNAFDNSYPAPDVMVGLAFDVPLLSLRGPLIDRAVALQTLAETTAVLDERRLGAAVTDAWERTDAAHRQLVVLHDSVVPMLEEARGLTLEGFSLGKLDLLRVLDAQRALLDNRVAEVTARATWARAVADLERTSGLDLESEGAPGAP